jgi:hypothetical protein
VLGNGRLSVTVEIDLPGCNAELNGDEVDEIVDDFEGLLLWKAVQQPNEGQPIAKAKPIWELPAFADLSEIAPRQASLTLALVAGEHVRCV